MRDSSAAEMLQMKAKGDYVLTLVCKNTMNI